MNDYRLNVRFDMDNPRERNAAEYLKQLKEQNRRTMNGFIVEAVCRALEKEESCRDFSLEDIREVVQDVLGSTLGGAPGGAVQAASFSPDQTGIDREKMDEMVLEDLSMFGC